MNLALLKDITGLSLELLKVVEFEDAYIEDETFFWHFSMPYAHRHLLSDAVIDRILEAVGAMLNIPMVMYVDFEHEVH